jgi:hypothetical protein
VAFRLDFPTWLTTLSHRDRDMVTDMGLGERTLDLADKYGCSPGRISQKRRWLRTSPGCRLGLWL